LPKRARPERPEQAERPAQRPEDRDFDVGEVFAGSEVGGMRAGTGVDDRLLPDRFEVAAVVPAAAELVAVEVVRGVGDPGPRASRPTPALNVCSGSVGRACSCSRKLVNSATFNGSMNLRYCTAPNSAGRTRANASGVTWPASSTHSVRPFGRAIQRLHVRM